MRWDALFDDLEGQLAEAARREWEAEVADRTRRERAEVTWVDRASASVGRYVSVHTPAGAVHGTLADLGRDWLLVDEGVDRPALVPHAAVLSVAGLTHRSDDAESGLGRRFGIGVALRAIARDRLPMSVHDVRGGVVVGTVDVVGLDYVEIAEHPADAVRRPESVTGVRIVPTAQVAFVRRAMQF